MHKDIMQHNNDLPY